MYDHFLFLYVYILFIQFILVVIHCVNMLYYFLGYLKISIGYLDNPPSSHILLIYETRGIHKAGAFVYNSSNKKWIHLGLIDCLKYVCHANNVCINGVIYLMSQAPLSALDPYDYFICFDLKKYEFSRFVCPDIIQRRLGRLIE